MRFIEINLIEIVYYDKPFVLRGMSSFFYFWLIGLGARREEEALSI
jgi:hypothetical protein